MIFGGGGDDTIVGGDGIDELHGGDGDDTIGTRFGGDEGDVAFGDGGDDVIEMCEAHGGPGTISSRRMSGRVAPATITWIGLGAAGPARTMCLMVATGMTS